MNKKNPYKPLPTDNLSGGAARANASLNLKALVEIDKQQRNANTLLFRYFDLPVNDGTAFYQVTQILKAGRVKIELCEGICLDLYADRILGNGGIFDIKIPAAQITRRDKLEKLFRRD